MSVDSISKLCDSISCHAWNGNRTKLALCPNDKTVRIYAVEGSTYTLETTLTDHDSIVTGIDWGSKTNRIVTCSQDRNAYVFNLDGNEWKPTLVILRLNRAATSVKWSPKEDKFAVGTGSRAIIVCYYDLEHGFWVSKHIKGPKSKITSTIKCLSWHPNNILLASAGTDNTVRVFSAFVQGLDQKKDVASGTPFGSKLPWAILLAEFSTKAWIHDIAFSPSGNQLAWVTHDSLVHFLECSTSNHQVQIVKTSGLPFQTILWAAENTVIAAGHDSNPALFQGGPLRYSFIGHLDKGANRQQGNTNAAKMWQQRAGMGTTELSQNLTTSHQNAITQIRTVSPTSFSSVGNDGQVALWTYSKIGVVLK
eukprot:TRINITY_DN7721_c0_g1_i5.p1 TRINITY_DN7721_c0_g1~~TRINITY_DN7721_c0_g1_i5.p1  ORF type:complete len:365 (-),score=36.95 TRINITY_DN7721_c0_g1_i5:112-1206(-)